MSGQSKAGIAKASRRQRNMDALAQVATLYKATLEAWTRQVENDEIEKISIEHVMVECIDISKDTDEWVQRMPGPWRRIEIVWQIRKPEAQP